MQVLPATTAAGVAFSETNKGYSELKQMYQAFCFNHPGLYDSDTGCDEYVKRMRAIVELVCRLEKEGQVCRDILSIYYYYFSIVHCMLVMNNWASWTR